MPWAVFSDGMGFVRCSGLKGSIFIFNEIGSMLLSVSVLHSRPKVILSSWLYPSLTSKGVLVRRSIQFQNGSAKVLVVGNLVSFFVMGLFFTGHLFQSTSMGWE